MNCAHLSRFISTRNHYLKAAFLLLGVIGLGACQAPSNTSPLTRTLMVSGKGEVNIPTTLTQVQLGVEVQNQTAEAVQQQVAQRSQAVVELLQSRQVEKLETTGIRLSPQYSYKDGEQSIKGYSGANMVSFRMPTDKVGTLLDDAVKAGATRIDSVSFAASDEAIATAQQDAIREATDKAKTQVSAALGALDLQQREIVNVQVMGGNQMPPPMPMAIAGELTQNSKVPTPIIGGEQEVAAIVTLQVRY
ncbi:SIMPL domain-containing protein [Trichocoleus sp. FACHB-591]|nr:SIMPL domain-containing protein [Trichocoleus sp. FACHB-591]